MGKTLLALQRTLLMVESVMLDIEMLLSERGITSDEEKEAFLVPDYDRDTHDPFLLLGMRDAVERIYTACTKKEKIAVYADFDADGIPAAVVLHDLFHKMGYTNIEVYIPHRDTEGFGFHVHAVELLASRGATLIITVDVGITGVEACTRARALGIDVIVTDHHLPPETIPDAYTIINPKQQGCAYPYKELCGAGVAYKLAQGILAKIRGEALPEHLQAPSLGWEKWLLDVVAIATIADMVPLTGENRVLAKFGLFVLRKTRRPGLSALMRATRIRQHTASEDDVGFFIAPRINAASRMDSPHKAFELLTVRSDAEAEVIASYLERLNRERKTQVAKITKDARKRIADDASLVLLGNPDWKPAFLGLAAQSLMQKTGKTVCLWGREGSGIYKGSCRATDDTSLPELFESLGDIVLQYGGHERAGGFSFSESSVFDLKDAFEQAHKRIRCTQKDMAVKTRHVYTADLSFVSLRTVQVLEQCAPFGLGNEKPLFEIRATVQSARRFGKGDAHLECMFEHGGVTVRGVSFFYEHDVPLVGEARIVQGTCERDTYRGGVVLRIDSLV